MSTTKMAIKLFLRDASGKILDGTGVQTLSNVGTDHTFMDVLKNYQSGKFREYADCSPTFFAGKNDCKWNHRNMMRIDDPSNDTIGDVLELCPKYKFLSINIKKAPTSAADAAITVLAAAAAAEAPSPPTRPPAPPADDDADGRRSMTTLRPLHRAIHSHFLLLSASASSTGRTSAGSADRNMTGDVAPILRALEGAFPDLSRGDESGASTAAAAATTNAADDNATSDINNESNDDVLVDRFFAHPNLIRRIDSLEGQLDQSRPKAAAAARKAAAAATKAPAAGTHRPSTSSRVSRRDWSTDEKWRDFRLGNKQSHIETTLEALVEAGVIKIDKKRKRDDRSGTGQGENDDDKDEKTREKRRKKESDAKRLRRACMYCTGTAKDGNNLKRMSRYDGEAPKRVSTACSCCLVTLCTRYRPPGGGTYGNLTCFQRWHKVRCLPCGNADWTKSESVEPAGVEV